MSSDLFVLVDRFGFASFFWEILSLQLIFMRKFPKRTHFWLRLFICFAVSFGLVFLPYLKIGPIGISFFIALFCAIVMSAFLLKANVLNCIFYAMTAWAAQHLAWSLLYMICMYVSMTPLVTALVYLSVYAATYIAVFLIFSYGRKDYEITTERLFVLVISAFVLFMVTFLYDLIGYYSQRSIWHLLYAIICCLFVLFTQFGISSREELKRERQKLEIEKSVLENLLYCQTKQQKLTGETIEIINRKCHDLKHQLNVLRTMKRPDSEGYLKEIEKAVMVYGDIAKTGNDALDITLTEKCLLCEEHKIKFTYIVDADSLSGMDAVDISTLFGNMLDNAIECEDGECEDRRIIRLHVSSVHDYLRIHCENYCSGEIQFEDGLPVSERRETGYHGFGAKSIRYLAEKYGGNAVMACEGELFNVNILLPLAPRSEAEV